MEGLDPGSCIKRINLHIKDLFVWIYSQHCRMEHDGRPANSLVNWKLFCSIDASQGKIAKNWTGQIKGKYLGAQLSSFQISVLQLQVN